MIWPFPPLAGMTESLEFNTEVLRARSSEQRIRLSDIPRRTFNATYKFSPLEYERARSMMRQNLPTFFYLPEWSEAIVGSFTAGQSTFTVDTTERQYFVDGFAAIAKGGDGVALDVTNVTSTSVSVFTGPSQDWRGAAFAPASRAFAPQGMEVQHDANGFYNAQVEWRIYDGFDWGENDYPVYRDHPVLTIAAQVGQGAISERITREVQVVDNGIAVPFFEDVYTEAIQTLGAKWIIPKTEVFSLRKWFYFLKGRQKAFWLPSWNCSMELMSDISSSDTDITINNIGFSDGYEIGDVFIKLQNNTVHTFQIIGSAAYEGNNETLFLSGAAGANISISDVKTICLMFKVRLDSDRIEFAYIPGHGASVQVPCVEVPV